MTRHHLLIAAGAALALWYFTRKPCNCTNH